MYFSIKILKSLRLIKPVKSTFLKSIQTNVTQLKEILHNHTVGTSTLERTLLVASRQSEFTLTLLLSSQWQILSQKQKQTELT